LPSFTTAFSVIALAPYNGTVGIAGSKWLWTAILVARRQRRRFAAMEGELEASTGPAACSGSDIKSSKSSMWRSRASTWCFPDPFLAVVDYWSRRETMSWSAQATPSSVVPQVHIGRFWGQGEIVWGVIGWCRRVHRGDHVVNQTRWSDPKGLWTASVAAYSSCRIFSDNAQHRNRDTER
jgi:hypothetical protein